MKNVTSTTLAVLLAFGVAIPVSAANAMQHDQRVSFDESIQSESNTSDSVYDGD